jgi:hypothetical protein
MTPIPEDAQVHDTEYVDAFHRFAMDYHTQDLAEILLKHDDDQHYAVQVR